MYPMNLALRFFLEIAALVGFGALAWQSTEGLWKYLAVTGNSGARHNALGHLCGPW